VELGDELGQIAASALAYADEGEELAAVIPAEPALGTRVYLCAFSSGDARSWLALDPAGRPLDDWNLVRDAVSIAALCELAEESAGGGRLEELRAQLAELARAEGRELTAQADGALAALEATLESPPRIASPAYLDRIGLAARRFEQALGTISTSPFAEAMKAGSIAVEGLSVEVEGAYKLPLE
jgi:hypothetical protein